MGYKVTVALSAIAVQVTNAGGTDVVYTQGAFYELEGLFGLCMVETTVAAGTTGEIVLQRDAGIYETSQLNVADTFALTDDVYWDSTNARFTTTAADNRWVGHVSSAKDANNVVQFVLLSTGNPLRATAHQINSIAPDVATLVTDFNALLLKLQSAGLMS